MIAIISLLINSAIGIYLTDFKYIGTWIHSISLKMLDCYSTFSIFLKIWRNFAYKLKKGVPMQVILAPKRLFAISRFTCYWMVEVVGVEPTSENISVYFSPSAAPHLLFRFQNRRKAGCSVGYPFSPPCLKECGMTFSCINDARVPACRWTGADEPQLGS